MTAVPYVLLLGLAGVTLSGGDARAVRSVTEPHAAVAAKSATTALREDALFQGIFLGQGLVAGALPEVWHRSPETTPPEAEMARRLTAEVRRVNPHFLSTLRVAIEWGERTEISKVVDLGVNELESAASRLGMARHHVGTDKPYVVTAVTCTILLCDIPSNDIAKSESILDEGLQIASSSGRLRHDRIVDAIATRLHSQP